MYGLLAKIGVKCEIHDCTIALFEYLFDDTVSTQLIQELRDSKRGRVETQYYPITMEMDLEEEMSQTKNFVLVIEKTLDSLNSEDVLRLQRKLKRLRTVTKRP